MHFLTRILCAFALLGLAACAGDRVTLLPSQDGSVGAVAVLDEEGEAAAVIDRPYELTTVRGTSVSSTRSDESKIGQRYGAVLGDLPPPPTVYVLYFETGEAILTEESRPKLAVLLDEVAVRPGAEVQVTGHTDTVGDLESNDELSRSRAGLIMQLLIQQGLDPTLVRAVGRGERDLLVQTEDEVDEPRNRRVAVIVR